MPALSFKQVRENSLCRLRYPKYLELGQFTLLFCTGRQEKCTKIYNACKAIVLLIKPFVWWCSHCRSCRDLFKVPNGTQTKWHQWLKYITRGTISFSVEKWSRQTEIHSGLREVNSLLSPCCPQLQKIFFLLWQPERPRFLDGGVESGHKWNSPNSRPREEHCDQRL